MSDENFLERPERLEHILRDLDLPTGQWCLNGSGVMVLHGIPRARPMGDVDIFVATRTWFHLYHQGLVGMLDPETENHPWKVWTTDPDDPKRRCDPPYLYKQMHGIEVNLFHDWRRRGVGDLDVNNMIYNAEYVRGWPCYPLRLFLDWKESVGRAKDATDIVQLRKHLEDGCTCV